MEYYSAIKRNEIVPFAETWMDLEIIIQSKVTQKENKNVIQYFLYVKLGKKTVEINLFVKQK